MSDDLKCAVCGGEPDNYSVPTFNGDIVSNHFPEDLWTNEGGNAPVCERCYDLHSRGYVPVADRDYLPAGRSFVGGDGI